jgi:hypothetical protein
MLAYKKLLRRGSAAASLWASRLRMTCTEFRATFLASKHEQEGCDFSGGAAAAHAKGVATAFMKEMLAYT